jgi:hypothetical protein
VAFNSSARPQKAGASSTISLRIPGVILSLFSIALAISGIFFALFSWHGPVSLLFSIVVGLFGTRIFVLWLGATQPAQKNLVTTQTPWVRSIPASDTWQLPVLAPGRPGGPHPHSIPSPAPAMTAIIPQSPYPLDYVQQTTSPGIDTSYNPHIAATIAMNVPIDEDPMFQVDEPVSGTQCFILPKEGELMFECQDRYALNAKRSRYAVANGVDGSFVPGPWARIICKNFVERGGDFASEEEFKSWLVACSQQWHMWMEQRWVPTMNAQRTRDRDEPGDWSEEILQGAQATLIGCSVIPGSPVRKTKPAIRVFAIGDSEFFLFRPHPENGWTLVKCFPYTGSHQFGSRPNTLMTLPRADLLERAWVLHQTTSINAQPGDRIILASAPIAQWPLQQVEQNTDLWVPFLNITDPKEFEYRMRHELHAGQIQDDDLTMLSIAVR